MQWTALRKWLTECAGEGLSRREKRGRTTRPQLRPFLLCFPDWSARKHLVRAVRIATIPAASAAIASGDMHVSSSRRRSGLDLRSSEPAARGVTCTRPFELVD
jgi:hypothetical protein